VRNVERTSADERRVRKISALRQKYPNDVEHIEREEKRVKAFLNLKEFASLETTQELLTMCRDEIVRARKRLATDRSLLEDPFAQQELWTIVDSRKWFIDLVARDFESELAIIEWASTQSSDAPSRLDARQSAVLHKIADIPRFVSGDG
jgi:hypothetical protein